MNPENKRYRYVNQASIMANPNGYEYVLPLDSEGAIDVTKDIYNTGIYNQFGENRGYRDKYDPKTTYFAVDDNGTCNIWIFSLAWRLYLATVVGPIVG